MSLLCSRTKPSPMHRGGLSTHSHFTITPSSTDQSWHLYNRDAVTNQNYTPQHSLMLPAITILHRFRKTRSLNPYDGCSNNTEITTSVTETSVFCLFLFVLYHLQTTAWSYFTTKTILKQSCVVCLIKIIQLSSKKSSFVLHTKTQVS